MNLQTFFTQYLPYTPEDLKVFFAAFSEYKRTDFVNNLTVLQLRFLAYHFGFTYSELNACIMQAIEASEIDGPIGQAA